MYIIMEAYSDEAMVSIRTCRSMAPYDEAMAPYDEAMAPYDEAMA